MKVIIFLRLSILLLSSLVPVSANAAENPRSALSVPCTTSSSKAYETEAMEIFTDPHEDPYHMSTEARAKMRRLAILGNHRAIYFYGALELEYQIVEFLKSGRFDEYIKTGAKTFPNYFEKSVTAAVSYIYIARMVESPDQKSILSNISDDDARIATYAQPNWIENARTISETWKTGCSEAKQTKK